MTTNRMVGKITLISVLELIEQYCIDMFILVFFYHIWTYLCIFKQFIEYLCKPPLGLSKLNFFIQTTYNAIYGCRMCSNFAYFSFQGGILHFCNRVGYRVPDDVSWSIIQNIYDDIDKNVEKTIFLAVYCRINYKIIYSTWYFY